MARPSSIHRLPENVREALHGWLNDPGITQEEAARRTNALLDEVAPDHPRVSRQAVNRYDQRYRETAREIREAREVAGMMIADLGSVPGGQVGHLLTEMIRTVSFRITAMVQRSELSAESAPVLVKQLKELSLISQRVERASDISAKRERQIRDEERRRAAEEAAETAAGEARSQGLSAEAADEIKRKILGGA